MTKCPYCSRNLIEHERYCYFCHQDVGKHVDRAQRTKIEPKPYSIKGDITKIKNVSKSIFRNLKGSPKEQKKEQQTIAYCVKCNRKVNVKSPKLYIMKSKREAVKGICPFCSRNVFRIIGMKEKSR